MATKKTKTATVPEETVVEITQPAIEQELANAESVANSALTKIAKLRALVVETERVVNLSSYGVEPAILTSQIKAILGE